MHRRFTFMLLALVLLLTASCRSTKEPPPPEPVVPLHERPKLPRRGLPISEFEHLAHWKVSSDAGKVELKKDLSQVLWGRASARISFSPELPGPRKIFLTPAEPWLIQSQFDTILLWIRHEGQAGLREDHRIRLRYRDATGKSGEWILPYSPSPEMQMLHIRVHEEIPTPVQVESLTWDLPPSASGVQNLYLDSLSIYQEVLRSIPQSVHYVRPFEYAPVFAPKRKNSVTLNFPTGPNAYRPQTSPGKSIHSLRRLDDSGYVFRYESNDMQLEYQIRPQPGMPAVEVVVNGKKVPDLWRGAGVLTDEGVPELRFARISGEHLLFQYTQGLQFEFSLHGKTLQVGMNSLLENVSELNLGRITGGNHQPLQTLHPPLFRIREDQRWPIFLLKGAEKTFLVSCFPDWWSSLSSDYQPPGDFTSPQSFMLGKMRYESKWRGNRNMFRERIYFTVSDRLLEVLPSPSMPSAMYRSEIAKGGAVDPVISPPINLMAIEALDEAWQVRLLARDGEGDWRKHPVKGYLIKSGLFDETPLQRLSDFSAEHSGKVLNVPVVAMFPPWRYLDYDVRSVGGGSFTQTFAEAGALLQQVEAEWGSAIVSRGGSEWFWSGLVSAIIPEFPLGIQELHPLLPHFAWYNVHPVSQILGLGKLEDFRMPTDREIDEERLLNRLLAMQVAYGAIGRVPEVERADLKLKAKRIQTLLQPLFADAKAVRIAYWSGDKFLDAGEAAGANVLWNSRLYVRLDSDTEIWVNGDLNQSWNVRVDGRDLRLPPFGFVVRGNELLVINLPENEKIPGLSLLQVPRQTWVSSPDKEVDELSIQIQGSLQIQEEQGGAYQLEIDNWQGKARISQGLLNIKQVGTLRGITSEGQPVEDLVLQRAGTDWILKSGSSLYRVWISPEISGSELNFSP